MTRCQCGDTYADTINGRHRHRLLNGHSPSPASTTPATGTRWDAAAALLPNLRKGQRTPR